MHLLETPAAAVAADVVDVAAVDELSILLW